MVTTLIRKYILDIQKCCLCYISYDFDYKSLISITMQTMVEVIHIPNLSKEKSKILVFMR